MKSFLHKIPVKRVLKSAALTSAGILCLLVLVLIFLPRLVSSHAVQGRIQKTISTSMKRTVTWSNLILTWSDGLTLSGLKMGDGPAPLLKSNIEQIVIAPGFSRGTDGRFGIDLTVKVHNVQAELAPGPPKPLPPPSGKDPLTQLADLIQKIQGLDYQLPLDVRVMVEVAPLNIVYRVPVPGKQLQLDDFSLRLAMPSLAAKPAIADVKGRLTVAGSQVGKVSLTAKVSDLVTKERRIHLASALFAVEAAAPGTSLNLSGGLNQKDGFTARCKLDLPKLLAVARPFAPPNVPDVAGAVDFQLLARVDVKRDLQATVSIDGAGLAARGGSLQAKRVGPLDLKLQQQIATDHVRQMVFFPAGSFAVSGLLNAEWSASVTRPSVPARTIDLTFGPLRLDLAKTVTHAAPFLPPNTPVKDLTGELSLRSLVLHLQGPANNGDVKLTGLSVKLPRLRLALKKGELAAENIELFLDKLACPLTARLPTALTAELLWNIKRAALSGTQPLTLQGAHGSVGLQVTDLNLKSASPRKIAAVIAVQQAFDLDSASLGTQASLAKMHERLLLVIRAADSGEVLVNVPEFTATVAALKGTQAGKNFGPMPLSVALTATNFRLPTGTGAKPTLQRASATISAGDFLQLVAEAALSGTAPQRATSSGKFRLDLHRAMPFAAKFVPSGLNADGLVNADWDMAAPLPEKPLVVDKHPLRSAKATLSLFDKLTFGVKLDNIAATIPSAKGTIRVTGLQTKPDLRVVVTNKGEMVRFDGGLLVTGINGLPGAAGKLSPQHGSLTFNGALSGWRQFQLNDELHIEPLALSHEAELNVSRVDALLEEQQPFSTATLIKRLDATLFANVDGAFAKELKQLLPGVEVAGTAGGAVRVDLDAGRELALRCSLQTKDFGVQLANGTKVEGLRSNIAINRVYALAAERGESWTPLSTSLVRPQSAPTANPGATELVGRINDDLRGDVNGNRSFSIRRVTVKASGVPLVLTALEGDLLFAQEKTGLSFFQGELLGGTLLARAVFDLHSEMPVIIAGSSFSNLDVNMLLPQETRTRQTVQDAEITGELSLTAPLTAEQRELFEKLRLALNVRKIGANTIERALFSLDPYERNEQVVAQRKMLRLGTLKGLRANAVDGAFSMEGEAMIKGVTIELPKVERLRISELPLRKEITKNRAAITALRGLLDLVRSDTLNIGPKGELSLKRRNYAQ